MTAGAPTLDLTDYQADQLRRLRELVATYPHMAAGYAVVLQKGVTEADVPAVYRELRDLGLVTITIADSTARVRPVAEVDL